MELREGWDVAAVIPSHVPDTWWAPRDVWMDIHMAFCEDSLGTEIM